MTQENPEHDAVGDYDGPDQNRDSLHPRDGQQN